MNKTNPFQRNILFFSTFEIILATFFMIGNSSSSFAQIKSKKNLVPNPSFEIHKNKSGEIKNAIPWVGMGTLDNHTAFSFSTIIKENAADHYTKPDKRDTSNFKGARTGKCYAGLKFQSDYKEYLYIQLLESLEKNKTYQYTMYVRLLQTPSVTVRVKQLGVYFSDIPLTIGMDFEKEGMIDSTYKNGISGTFDWISIHGDYIAHGGEKFIIIGNFRTKMKDDFVKNKKGSVFESQEAYYYLDDVSLFKKVDTLSGRKIILEPIAILPDSFTIGQVVEIKNIEFEKGTEKTLKVSNKILDDLVRVLSNHPFMGIQINVISDSQAVSKGRAKAIFEYLKEHDAINPMTYKGLVTPPGEQVNSRVEIVITSQ